MKLKPILSGRERAEAVIARDLDGARRTAKRRHADAIHAAAVRVLDLVEQVEHEDARIARLHRAGDVRAAELERQARDALDRCLLTEHQQAAHAYGRSRLDLALTDEARARRVAVTRSPDPDRDDL